MNQNIKEIAKKITKEALGNLPYGGFVIPFVELLEELVKPEQLEAATKWVLETKATSLDINKDQAKPVDISNWLKTNFSNTRGNESSYAFGYPRSFIKDGILIQFQEEESINHLTENENRGYLGFNPQEIVSTLDILVADNFEWGESQDAMPGDESPILIPSENANVEIITIVHSKLSSPILSYYDRFTATFEKRRTRNEEGDKSDFSSWDEVQNLLAQEIPSIKDMFTQKN